MEMVWAVGVTTVPQRFGHLLPRTLASLKAAGFPLPRLFVDGSNDTNRWQTQFGCEVSCRYPRIRGYANWVLGLAELYARNPHAQRFAMFQDDVVVCQNLRAYLDGFYPEGGYLNLSLYPENQRLSNGRTGWIWSNQVGLGAQGLVFNRSAVVAMLTHPHMITKPQDANLGWKNIDGAIASTFKKMGGKEFVHSPGLLQHTGLTSTLGNPRQPTFRGFVGESFDALQLVRQC